MTALELTNEAEVLMALERRGMQAVGVSLDGPNITHAERVQLLSSSGGMVSVGGAWLAHMAFLPADERATAVVEIYICALPR